MSPEELQRRLRALPNGGELFVQRNREWAVKHRRHPDAYQVWDREVVTRKPYCVISIEIDDAPAALDDRVVGRIAKMLRDAAGRRRDAWLDEITRKQRDDTQALEDSAINGAMERIDADKDKAFHAAGWKRHWGLSRCDLPTSSTASATRSTTSARRTMATQRSRSG